jgi:hypothetical protein
MRVIGLLYCNRCIQNGRQTGCHLRYSGNDARSLFGANSGLPQALSNVLLDKARRYNGAKNPFPLPSPSTAVLRLTRLGSIF